MSDNRLNEKIKMIMNEVSDEELKTLITNYSLNKCDYMIVNSLNYFTVTEINNLCECIELALKTIIAGSITNDRDKLKEMWDVVPITFEDAIKSIRNLSHLILESNDKKKDKEKSND